MEWGGLGSAHRMVFSSSGLLPGRANCWAPGGAPSLSLPAAGEVMEMEETEPRNHIPSASSLLQFLTEGGGSLVSLVSYKVQ